MCGIVGRLNFNDQRVNPNELHLMCQAISHRGPDDQGVWHKGPIGLGNRRLSIIDLSSAGHQPISNEDKTIWITFNGEIYNFKELRRRMIKKGHRFRSHTDTEIIVHLWEEYGVNCLKYLQGMFALALWDDRKKILFLARDRMGKKPLKYYLDNQKIIFASELKAILQANNVKKEPDLKAIDLYFGLEAVPAPWTGFKRIKKLPQASYLLVKNNQVIIKKYWQLDFLPKLELGEPELKQAVLDTLTEAVKLRMVADVPVGAFLSGGVDSSAIVAIMAKLSQKRINTFSVGFSESQYNELDYARIVAKRFNTIHHEVVLQPQSFSMLGKLAQIYEEPYGDPSALPTYLVSQLASQKLKVVLTGDGGDDIFAGYQRYQRFTSIDNFHRLTPTWIKWILKLMLWPSWPVYNNTRILLWELLSGPGFKNYAAAYQGFQSPVGFKKKLYSPDFLKQINPDSGKKMFLKYLDNSLKPLDNVLLADLNIYLGQVLLPKIDLASMSQSLEVRSPFLDHHLVELAAKMPVTYKLKMGTTKYILKRSLEKILPKEIIYRPKMGFGFPLGKWLRNQWQRPITNLLLDPKSKYQNFLKPETVKTMIERPESGEHNDRRLWRVIMFEYWLQHYFPKL